MTAAAPVHPGSRLLGNAIALRRDPLGFVSQMQAEYGDLVTAPVGPPRLRLDLNLVMSPAGA